MLIYICDDHLEDLTLLKKHIYAYANEKSIDFTINEFTSGEELLANLIASKSEPTIVFLDIFMGQVSGIEVAKQLRDKKFSGGLIFTTTSRDFAVEGFGLCADGYLCKPYGHEQFVLFLDRCIHRLLGQFKTLTIVSERREFQILLHRIEYIETCRHGCIVHAENHVLRTRESLSNIDSKLSQEACFIRCGRSYIVNMNAALMGALDGEFIHLKNGERILIPVRERNKINSQIANFYWTQTRETEGVFPSSQIS